jgi:prophage tail gpP-like protein
MGRTKVTARIDVEVSVQGKTHERWWRLSLVRDLESYAVDLGTPGDEQVATALS